MVKWMAIGYGWTYVQTTITEPTVDGSDVS